MIVLLLFNSSVAFMLASSVYWFVSWLVLELASFIFVMILSITRSNSPTKKVSTWKYFLYQCLGTILFLFCLFLKANQIGNLSSETVSTIIMVGLFMKMGLPPFHKWSFEVSENLNWLKFIVINTIQKIPPLIMVWKLMDMDWSMILFSLFAMFFSLMALFDWSLRRFLMYSSVLNYTWCIMCSTVDSVSMLMYLTVYLWTFIAAVQMVSKYSFSCFSFLLNNNSMLCLGPMLNIFLTLNIMSLAGLPPLAGFITKYEVVMCLIWNSLIIISLMFMLISMVILLMYLIVLISSSMSNKLVKGPFTYKDSFTVIVCVFNVVAPLVLFL